MAASVLGALLGICPCGEQAAASAAEGHGCCAPERQLRSADDGHDCCGAVGTARTAVTAPGAAALSVVPSPGMGLVAAVADVSASNRRSVTILVPSAFCVLRI